MEEEDQQRKRQERSRSEALFFSPSFNSYSSHHAAEHTEKNSTNFDDNIEFSFVRTSDEILGEGQNRQIFRVFNRDLFIGDDRDSNMPTELTRRVSLRKLFDYEDAGQVEANELKNVPEGTYSVWRPNIVERKPARRCKKSNSTRFGLKTWNLRDSILRRSYREGKESNSLSFSTPKNSREHEGGEKAGKLFDDYKSSTSRLSFERLFCSGAGDKGRDPPLSSSSRADELESVPTGTYSVWRPKVVEKSPSRCKKSTKSSAAKQWKLCDFLLPRGYNKGKEDSYKFLTPKNREPRVEKTGER